MTTIPTPRKIQSKILFLFNVLVRHLYLPIVPTPILQELKFELLTELISPLKPY